MVLIGTPSPEEPGDEPVPAEGPAASGGGEGPVGEGVPMPAGAAGAPGGGAAVDGAPEAGVTAPAHRRRRRIIAAALAAVAVAAIVVELVLLLSSQSNVNHLNSVDSARTSALAAARAYTTDIATYDYRNLQQDFATVEQHATPSFQAQYAQSSKALMSVLTAYHAIAKANVLAAGLQSATGSNAVADVFLDQTVTNSTQKAPTTDHSRVQITLVRQHGEWLIDQLKLI